MQLNGRDVTVAEMGSLALYNYGHFTSMRVENSSVPGLSLHLERLQGDCATLFDVSLDLDFLRQLLRKAAASFTGPATIRVTIFDPDLDLGHPGNDSSPQILISSRPAASAALPPLRLKLTEYARDLPTVKHVGLFETIRGRRMAQRQGYDDVLFVGSDGRITEGATWNIGFFDGARILWPEADVLPGVTMRLVETVLRARNIPSVTVPLESQALGDLRAAFATNVSVGVRPIVAIDEHEFPAELPVVSALREGYFALPAEPI